MSIESRPTMTPQLAVGICLIVFGALLTLDRLSIVAATESLRLWPTLLVILGGWMLVQRRDGGGRGWGYILVFLGCWLLLNTLGILRVGFWELFWPVVIIYVGASLVMRTMGRTSAPSVPTPGAAADGSAASPPQPNGPPSAPAESVNPWFTPFQHTSGTGTANLFAVLGGCTRVCVDNPFRGGEMTSIMGGCRLDLRQAVIPPGEEATINVFSMMGGHELWVPSNWAVVSKVMPLLGGVDDKRLSVGATASDRAQPRLVLQGVVVMGGLIIKS